MSAGSLLIAQWYVLGIVLAQGGGPGATIQSALDQIAPELRILGIGMMTLGLIIFGLSKLAQPFAPELAASSQGYIMKAFMGMMVIGLATTLASWAGALFPG